MEQDLRDEGTARSPHVVHVLPSHDQRIAAIVRAQVERVERVESEASTLRVLVLVPSEAEGSRIAGAVNDGLDASGALLTPATDRARSVRRIGGAGAIITTPSLAHALMRRSALKLDAVQTVVLLDLDTLTSGDTTQLDEVLAELPKGADRVASAEELTSEVEAFLERHARRARRMQYDANGTSDATLHYVVADRMGRATVLARLLDAIDPEHATVVAAEEDAEAACSALAHLGYGPDDTMVAFSDGDVPDGEALVILYTAPADAEDVEAIMGASPARVIALVAPDELASFHRVFGQSATAVLPQVKVQQATSAVASLRDVTRHVLETQSLHHQLLALAPLFDEHDPAEVAAALLALLERQASEPAASPPPSVSQFAELRASHAPREDRSAPRARESSERPAAAGTFTPVFMSIGIKDGAKKGDLVGAITGEAGISSELLGKITMRDVFSVVEIDASVADKVIAAITGKAIRGRVVNARVDQRPPMTERSDRGDRGDRGGRSGGDRPMRRSTGTRGPRDDSRPARPRTREGGFSGGPSRGPREGGFAGGGSRGPREGGFAGGGARGRDAGDRPRRPREDGSGPRSFRDNDRGPKGPRAIGESKEWGDRGERLRNARRPRRGTD